MTPLFLIADDSPQKIMMLQYFLKKAKWDGPILTAESTEDALALIDEHPDIGFAFIDYYMPSDNGPAVIHRLASANPSAHIALVSSSDTQSNFNEARAAGAESCVCTSYPSDHVERTMMELLEEWKNP